MMIFRGGRRSAVVVLGALGVALVSGGASLAGARVSLDSGSTPVTLTKTVAASAPPVLPGAPKGSDASKLTGAIMNGLSAVRTFGPAHYPDVYGGIATDTSGSVGQLVIYLTTQDPRIRDQFIQASGLPAAQVQFRGSTITRNAAIRLNDRIKTDWASLQAQGFQIQGFGQGPDMTEVISIDHATTEQLTQLTEWYGPTVRFILDPPKAMFAIMRSNQG